MKRRIIIHTDDTLKPVSSAIECDLIRYLSGEIIGVIDKSNSGKTVQDVIGFGGDIPIAATMDEFLTLKPNYGSMLTLLLTLQDLLTYCTVLIN